jgi:hypothetical protein
MRVRRTIALSFAVAAAACSRHHAPGGVYELDVRGGTYQDGSGRIGLAVLASLRDGSGLGPAAPLAATVSDGTGPLAEATYAAGGAGSYAAWWWPEVAVRDGERYALDATAASGSYRAEFSATTAGGLDVPAPALAPDGASLSWPDVVGAASYACRVYQGGALQLEALVHTPACDVSALPPGAYAASVLALTADLAAIAASGDRSPPMPARFDVSEGRLAFVRPGGTAPAVTLAAAGGALDYGTSTPGLAVWLSIRAPDGTPTANAWDVSVVGPGLSAAAPLTFTYPAQFPRQMVWSYDVPATPGTYALTATSGAQAITTTFAVGTTSPLPFVLDATAAPAGSLGARVDFSAVDGARAYLVDVWDPGAQRTVASQWVPAPPAVFPDGSFADGIAYDVYVAATDADMSGATVPLRFSVSEYPYSPAGFVAAAR